MTVRGDHFRPRERVRLEARADKIRATADRHGVFIATIPGATRCDVTRILATGSGGSRAVLKLLPPRACLAVRRP